jgi:hypothetical protein
MATFRAAGNCGFHHPSQRARRGDHAALAHRARASSAFGLGRSALFPYIRSTHDAGRSSPLAAQREHGDAFGVEDQRELKLIGSFAREVSDMLRWLNDEADAPAVRGRWRL